MSGPKYPGFDTLTLHAGQRPDPATGARAVPIYASTSFCFEDSEHAASLFNMERAGHVYSRISNPTVAVVEERIAALRAAVSRLPEYQRVPLEMHYASGCTVREIAVALGLPESTVTGRLAGALRRLRRALMEAWS